MWARMLGNYRFASSKILHYHFFSVSTDSLYKPGRSQKKRKSNEEKVGRYKGKKERWEKKREGRKRGKQQTSKPLRAGKQAASKNSNIGIRGGNCINNKETNGSLIFATPSAWNSHTL